MRCTLQILYTLQKLLLCSVKCYSSTFISRSQMWQLHMDWESIIVPTSIQISTVFKASTAHVRQKQTTSVVAKCQRLHLTNKCIQSTVQSKSIYLNWFFKIPCKGIFIVMVLADQCSNTFAVVEILSMKCLYKLKMTHGNVISCHKRLKHTKHLCRLI